MKRYKQKERTETERRLQKAGGRNRVAAAQKTSKKPGRDDGIGYSEVELRTVISPSVTSRSGRGRNKRRREVVDWAKDEIEWLREKVRMQTALRDRKMKVDEAQLKMEQDQVARKELLEGRKLDREEKEHKLHERRISVDEKRLELEKQRLEKDAMERRGMIEKRSKVLDVLVYFANSLN